MNSKRPYWQHPYYDENSDPGYMRYLVTEYLKPITLELEYVILENCICDQKATEHDNYPIKYTFDNGDFIEVFPSCPNREKLSSQKILEVISLKDDVEAKFILKKVQGEIYIVEYSFFDIDAAIGDSGGDAAWAGGNVFPGGRTEPTSEEREKIIEIFERERREFEALELEYESPPFARTPLEAILVKANSRDLVNAVYDFLALRHSDLINKLQSDLEKGMPLQDSRYEGGFEISFKHETDVDFIHQFEERIRGFAKN